MESSYRWTRFAEELDWAAEQLHESAVEKGFYSGGPKNFGEQIALIHSELSEALEAARHDNPNDQHLPEFSSVEVELADTIIRVLDVCGYKKIRIGEVLVAKMQYNKKREHKHGKEF